MQATVMYKRFYFAYWVHDVILCRPIIICKLLIVITGLSIMIAWENN